VAANRFAAQLAQVMTDLNLSRVALARELGVDKSVVGRWLAGTNRPTGHNLTRLTAVVRQHWPHVTLAFWNSDPDAANKPPLSRDTSHPGLRLTGLNAQQRPAVDANYVGFWAGFYQSTGNRGAAVLIAVHLFPAANGLRAEFTEGGVSGEGLAIALGPRLHLIAELIPLHDRLCLFVFNGVGRPDSLVMDGVYAISSGDAVACATATPILLFRIGSSAEFGTIGGIAAAKAIAEPINKRNLQRCATARDPCAGLADFVPHAVLQLVCPLIGTPRPDGETDHVLRMPASRALGREQPLLEELPDDSPIRTGRTRLRHCFGLP
jgi:hypothetical protein